MSEDFKVVIAGSRGLSVSSVDIDEAVLELGRKPDVVFSGCCDNSPDIAGEKWAKENGAFVVRFPANWRNGKQAGILRNCEMAKQAHALIAFWDGESRGTKHMIDEAKRRGLKVVEIHKGER